jgi:hypothetical protein
MMVTSLNLCDMSSSCESELHQRMYRSVEPLGVLITGASVSEQAGSLNHANVCNGDKPGEFGSDDRVRMFKRCLKLQFDALRLHDVVRIQEAEILARGLFDRSTMWQGEHQRQQATQHAMLVNKFIITCSLRIRSRDRWIDHYAAAAL